MKNNGRAADQKMNDTENIGREEVNNAKAAHFVNRQ
jgi:hypothetical protein